MNLFLWCGVGLAWFLEMNDFETFSLIPIWFFASLPLRFEFGGLGKYSTANITRLFTEKSNSRLSIFRVFFFDTGYLEPAYGPGCFDSSNQRTKCMFFFLFCSVRPIFLPIADFCRDGKSLVDFIIY